MVYVDECLWDFDLEVALQNISVQRREQALRYRHELGRRQSVLAYVLLKKALRETYGIDENPLFTYGEHGQPLLADYPDIHLSLSHCRQAVVCAVSDHPVGVDVEDLGRYKESLARYAMNEAERAEIAAAADGCDVAFTRLWTMKEAFLKSSGRGLTDHLKTVLDGVDCRQFKTIVNSRKGYVYSVFSSDFVE